VKLHCIQHVPYEGLGYIENWAGELGAEISWTRLHLDQELPSHTEFDLLVILGGPMGVDDLEKHSWLKREKEYIHSALNQASTKVLGICLGAQLIAELLGAEVRKNAEREVGWFEVIVSKQASKSRIGAVLPECFNVYHWHSDTFTLPDSAIHLASSKACLNQAFVVDDRVLGLQFHAEMTPLCIKRLISHNPQFFTPSCYVQTAEEMLSDQSAHRMASTVLLQMLDSLMSQQIR